MSKVILRIHRPRAAGDAKDDVKKDNWTPGEVETIRGLVGKVQHREDGAFRVKADFNRLSAKLGRSKREIYQKLVEQYHVVQLHGAESTTTTSVPVEKEAESTTVSETFSSGSTGNGTGNGKGNSVLQRLEQLKLGQPGIRDANDNRNVGVDLLGLDEDVYDDSGNDEDDIGESREERDDEGDGYGGSSSEASVINMASASVYLQRSQLLTQRKPKTRLHDSEDYLLASGSIHDSDLEQEILKRI